MNKKILSILKVAAFLGFGVLLIWLSVNQLKPEDITEIKKSLSEANYWWLVLSMLVCVISHGIRAYRWNMLLAPMGHKASFSNAFFAVMVGYFVNYGVPRLGEISRCTVVDRYEKIPFTKAFGTVVAERVIDMLIFFIMFFIMLFSQYGKIAGYMNENVLPVLKEKWAKLSGNSTALIIMAGLGLLVVVGLFYFRKKIRGKLGEKVKGFVKGFAEGLKAVGKVKNPLVFIFLSLMIWVCYYAMLHLCFYCLNASSHLGFSEGITAMVFGTFTVMITPGGIGAYPLALQKVLNKIYFLPEPVGFAVGWLSWLAGFIITVILGVISFVLLPVLNKKKDESAT